MAVLTESRASCDLPSTRGLDRLDRDQGGAEVTHLGEQAVQLGLVGHCATQGGGAVVFADEGQSAEPGRPVLVEVSLDPEFVMGRCVRPPSWLKRRSSASSSTGVRTRRRLGPSRPGLSGPPESEWFRHNPYAEWYANTIRIPGSLAAQHQSSTHPTIWWRWSIGRATRHSMSVRTRSRRVRPRCGLPLGRYASSVAAYG